MVCGGCTSTISKAVSNIPGVSSVNVSLLSQSVKVEAIDTSLACTCSKDNGGSCGCGDGCKCFEKAVISACDDVGFDAEATDSSTHQCGEKADAGPCGATDCTCGDNCQCGSSCSCSSCPGKKKSGCCQGSPGSMACGSPTCNCVDCKCGVNCTCSSCPGAASCGGGVVSKGNSVSEFMSAFSFGVACFAIGWFVANKNK